MTKPPGSDEIPEWLTDEAFVTSKKTYQRIPLLYKKTKGLIWDHKKLKSFKEPCALLMRGNGSVEFYENIRGTEYNFEHSNGRKARILLYAQAIKNFDYAGTTFKGYILDENKATPIRDGTEYSDHMSSLVIDNTIKTYSAEIEKLRLEEAKQAGKTWMNVFIGVALVIIAYGVYKMMSGAAPAQAAIIAENVTNITRNMTGIQVIG